MYKVCAPSHAGPTHGIGSKLTHAMRTDDGDDIHNALKNEFNPQDLEKDGIIMKNDGPDESGKIKWQRNHTTVPNVWIGKEQVGGRTDVDEALRDGSLKKKLQAAGAL